MCAAGAQAAHCWRFCGGWVPDRLLLYAALYPVDNWYLLIHLLETIRDHD